MSALSSLSYHIIIYNCLSYSTSSLKVWGCFLSSLEMDSQIHPFPCLCQFPPDLADQCKVHISLLLSMSLAPALLVLPLLWVLYLVLFGHVLGLSPLLPASVVESVWLRPPVPFVWSISLYHQIFKGYRVYWVQGGIVCFRPWDVKFNDGVCSLALALSLSQSSLDQSDWSGKGCGTCCLKNEYMAPNHSHTFWEVHFMMLILFTSARSVPNVLT